METRDFWCDGKQLVENNGSAYQRTDKRPIAGRTQEANTNALAQQLVDWLKGPDNPFIPG
jgi:hypothetical protein